jgi:hypothetical protein
MKPLLILLFLASLFFSTNLFSQGKTSYANFQVLEPGEVKFPSGIKKFVLANRSYQKTFFPDKNKFSYLYELQQILLSANFYAVDIFQFDESRRSKNPDEVLSPLDWETVAKLLNDDTTAELIVLEQKKYIRFDYLYEKQYGNFPGYSYKNSDGDSASMSYKYFYKYQYYPAYPYERTYSYPFVSTVGTGIRTGTQYFWRIYDLKTKKIIDDYEERTEDDFFSNPLTFGDNPEQYMLLYYNEEISYALHLLPHWLNVSRDYYIDGNDEMKTANEFAVSGQMDSAKVIWKKLSGNSSAKIARKACYNSALGFEIDGQLDSALVYAQRSQVLGDKNAPFYVSILKKRIVISRKADAQVKAGEGILPAIKYYQKKY